MKRTTATKLLAALIAVQLVVAAVAAATVDDTNETPLGGNGTTTTTIPGDTAAGDTGASGGTVSGETSGENPAGAPASPDTGPSSSGGGTALGGADLRALPERPSPPRPGGYPYRDKFDGNAAFGSFTTQVKGDEETTTRFEALEADAAGPRDRQRQDGSSTSGGFTASGSASEERSWRSDGMYVTNEAASANGDGGGEFNGSCQWQPPLRKLAFPLRVGAAWSWDSRCETKSEDGEFRRRSQGSAKVTGKRTVTVAGKEVAVLVIEVRSTDDLFVSSENEGRKFDVTTHVESEGLDLYASSVALVVRAERKMNGTSQSSQAPGQTARFEGDSLRELLSLDPR